MLSRWLVVMLLQDIENHKTIETLEELENSNDDSTRMYKAIKLLKTQEPKKRILVNGENGVATDEKQQVEIITDFYEKIFRSEDAEEMQTIPPTEMKTHFTGDEVQRAVKSLKNNKSPGIDNLKAELIKYGPSILNECIAEIYNDMARTGKYPTEVKEGILIPIPKPGKKQGPPGHLRPIILLSILRKILAICLLRRAAHKFYQRIPITQAAYREGRSTTELIFAFKVLAEKAVTSKSYKIHLLMLDMSKAFDTVKREELFRDLKEILDDDELHLMMIMLKDVELQIRVGKEVGRKIRTNIGVPQGDSLSPLLFTLYLAQALKPKRVPTFEEHNYSLPPRPAEELVPKYLIDHTYSTPVQEELNIDQQYADDISYATDAYHIHKQHKATVPPAIKERNLSVNTDKTEEYEVSRTGNEEWKKCKLVGSLIDTTCDINRRRGLALNAYNKLKKILESRKVNIKLKVRVLNTYIKSIFLYNCEIWTITKELENSIDIFQRTLMRRAFNIYWRDKISNEEIYNRAGVTEWSIEIKKRRLKWLGHLLRLPDETPARQALHQTLLPIKRPRGKPKTTWISMIKKEMKALNIDFSLPNLNQVVALARDRTKWNSLVGRAMSK